MPVLDTLLPQITMFALVDLRHAPVLIPCRVRILANRILDYSTLVY